MNSDVSNEDKTVFSKIKDYFNILIIGDSSVGKTCILEKYVNNFFQIEPKNKKFIEVYKKKICFNKSFYNLKFWDITKFIGNNDISNIDMFYNCDGIIFVSSYDNKSSLENINLWYQLLIEYADLSKKEMIWFINKKDLEVGKILKEEEIEKKSKDLQLDFYEVSAKTGENVEKGINNIIKKLIKRNIDSNLDLDVSTNDSSDNINIEVKERKKCNIF